MAAPLLTATFVACQNGNDPRTVAHIALSPPWTSIPAGDTVSGSTSVQARFVTARGDTVATGSVTWLSTDTSVARIDATGVVRAGRVGQVAIRGMANGETVEQLINVTDPVLVGAGDIGTCQSNNDDATALLLDSLAGVVFTAGDNDYSDAMPVPPYGACYDASWGRHKPRTRPAPGEDDRRNAGLQDYFAYFGAVAHPPTGYYSYDLGTWHIVVLNVTPSADAVEVQWLRDDLAAHPNLCTMVVSHRPRFSSGNAGSSSVQAPIFQALYDFGADILLSGNDHDYERFSPQAPDGSPDAARGVVQLIVGTGGKSHGGINQPLAANSVISNADTYGVLRLVLHPAGYDWRFIPVAGKSFTDSGSGTCH